MCRLHLQEAARDRDHLQMMLVPDPVQLRFSLDSDSIAQGHQIVVQALGCGGDVPRLLRATGQVLASHQSACDPDSWEIRHLQVPRKGRV